MLGRAENVPPLIVNAGSVAEHSNVTWPLEPSGTELGSENIRELGHVDVIVAVVGTNGK